MNPNREECEDNNNEAEREEQVHDKWIDGPQNEAGEPSYNVVGEDFGHYFRSGLMWDSKEDLYQWAKERANDLMITLTKRTSSTYCIDLVCDRFGESRSRRLKVNSEIPELPVSRTQNHRSKKCGCRFELYGVRTRKEGSRLLTNKWVLDVIEGRHNHMLSTTFHEKTSVKQAMNFLQKLQFEDYGEIGVTQWSINFLVGHKYVCFPLRSRETKVVEILFFANEESLRLFKKYPHMVIIDATCKTNKYNMTLVEIVGFTCTYKTFNIAYAFTAAERVSHYKFIMSCLHKLCVNLGVMPMVIMIDCEKALMKAIRLVFKEEVQQLLCWLHIRKKLKAHADKIIKVSEKVDNFTNQCWEIFCSTTEDIYEERLKTLRISWESGLVRYVEDEWLTPYKKYIVRAWTDCHLHFFSRTSNKVEGMRRVLKDIVGTRKGGFNRVILRIHHAIILQIDQIRETMNNTLTTRPMMFNDPKLHPAGRMLFSRLLYRVSDRCFDLLFALFERIKKEEYTEECDDRWLRDCLGLPCIHDIAKSIIAKTPLVLDDIHDFWKQLKWEDTATINVSDDDNRRLSIPKLKMREFWSRMEADTLNEGTLLYMSGVNADLELSEESSSTENICSKGMTSGVENKDMSNPREKSHHEPVSEDEEPMFYMGVDFGIRNIDDFWYPYISYVRDVRSDGHCGYRSMAVLVGMKEAQYGHIRAMLGAELLANPQQWEPIRRITREGTWDDLIDQVNYMRSPCSEQYWLDMPFMGLVFATVFNVCLVQLSYDVPFLCLPIRQSASSPDLPQQIVAIAHVGNQDHWIPVLLRDCCPLPRTPDSWKRFSDPSIRWWEGLYQSNFDLFRTYRMTRGRPVD